MNMIQTFLAELEQEAKTTKKMLQQVPNDQYDYKPHLKSMDMRNLAVHIADLPSWVDMAINTSGLDFAATPYETEKINDTNHLLDYFERSFQKGKKALQNAKEDLLAEKWTLRNAEEIYSVSSKAEIIRMSINQTIHHRAQLGVYLRLLNIPIPGSYGPSADDPSF